MFVEYAKAAAEDILIKITAWNRGPEPAPLHLLPTLWFRNRWAWGDKYERPQAVAASTVSMGGSRCSRSTNFTTASAGCSRKARRKCSSPKTKPTWSASSVSRIATPYVKDAFHATSSTAEQTAVNPEPRRDEMRRALSMLRSQPGQSWTIRLRLTDQRIPTGSRASANSSAPSSSVFEQRMKEADEFYAQRIDPQS